MGLTDGLQRPHASTHHIHMQSTKSFEVRVISVRSRHARRQRNPAQSNSRLRCDSRPGASEPSRDPALPSNTPKAKPTNFNPFKNTKKEASPLPNRLCNITCLNASCWRTPVPQSRVGKACLQDFWAIFFYMVTHLNCCRMQHEEHCKICSRARMTC